MSGAIEQVEKIVDQTGKTAENVNKYGQNNMQFSYIMVMFTVVLMFMLSFCGFGIKMLFERIEKQDIQIDNRDKSFSEFVDVIRDVSQQVKEVSGQLEKVNDSLDKTNRRMEALEKKEAFDYLSGFEKLEFIDTETGKKTILNLENPVIKQLKRWFYEATIFSNNNNNNFINEFSY